MQITDCLRDENWTPLCESAARGLLTILVVTRVRVKSFLKQCIQAVCFDCAENFSDSGPVLQSLPSAIVTGGQVLLGIENLSLAPRWAETISTTSASNTVT